MNKFEDKLYTEEAGFLNEQYVFEKIFPENKDIGLVIPKKDYRLRYDVTSKNRITDTIVIDWENSKERYIVIPSIKDDPVLIKYGLDAGLAFFILHFDGDELIDLGGIFRDTYETYYFQKEDFQNKDKNTKPRILQAPIAALYTPGLFVKGLRELGYKADQMIYSVGSDIRFLEREPEFDLDAHGNPTEVCRARTIEFMIYALKNYDIMHFHSNCSLLFGGERLWNINSDMAYVSKMGKKILCSSWGMCDVSLRGEMDKFNWHSECLICKRVRPLRCENEKYNNAIKTTRKYADVLLTNGRGVIADKRQIWLENAIDFENFQNAIDRNIPEKFMLPKTDKLRIYHAFANADKRDDEKGSQFVKEAVERLQKEGYSVELIYFQNVDHNDLKYYQVQADIIVDQLYSGWYGSNGAECLALGLPVITYVNPDVEKFLREELGRDIPVVSADPQTIYDVLKDLVLHPQKRDILSKKAMDFATKYHDYREIVKKLSAIYDALWNGK